MSTDIYAHVEVQIGTVWHHYSALPLRQIPQDYRLYGKMAGVRDSDIKPIVAPRGMPEDVTFLTHYSFLRQREDAHHMSWLGVRELINVAVWYQSLATSTMARALKPDVMDCEDLFGYLFGNSWESLVVPGRATLPPQLNDARLVFWFVC